MKMRKSMLSASIAAALLFAATAQAQNPASQSPNAASGQAQTTTSQTQTSGTSSNPQELQTITVVGIRASLMKSLETKRAANAIVSAVTAEDIGQFPNTNVAEAMTMMPGITVDRRFGQGGRVSVNGTDPNLNLSYLDGHPVANVDWLFGATPDRGFDYAILAPDIVGNIEVYKTAEARLPSGSLGGTIMIHSQKPLDMPANTLAVSLGGDYNDQAKRGGPTGSLTYSWKNSADTFGVDVAASHLTQYISRQGNEIFGYHPFSDYLSYQTSSHSPKFINPVVQNAFSTGQAKPTDMVPDEVNSANFRQTRKRDSLLFNAQWKPNNQWSFLLGGLYVRENFQNFNQSMYGFQHSVPGNLLGFTDANGLVTSTNVCGLGQTNNNGLACTSSGMTFDNNARGAVTRIKGLHLDGAFNGNHWGVSGQLGISTAHVNQTQYFLEPVYLGGYSQSFGGWSFDNPSAATDPSNWGSFSSPGDTSGFKGNYTQFPFNAKTTYGQVDFHVDFDSIFNRLQFGARYVNDKHNAQESIWSGGVTGFTLGDLGQMQFPTTMQANTFADVSADMKQHISPTRSDVINWVMGSPDLFNPGIYAPSFLENTWNLTQRTQAAYVQQDFDTGTGLRGNFGVRFVRNAFTSTSYVPASGVKLTSITIPDGIPPDWLQTKTHTFNDVLPSFNVIYDMGNNIVLRGSAAKVIAWAPYNQMVNNLFLNSSVLTGSGGNADLGPYKSYVYQGSVEWYFQPQSVVAFNAFYYHILNYLSTTTTVQSEFNGEITTDPTQFAQFVANGTCQTTGYCDFQITKPGSIGQGAIKGFSLAYQQAFGDTGFGLLANYTYANGTTHIGEELPYNSKNSFTVSPYYQGKHFSARISYNWRSKYIAGGYVAGAPPATVNNQADLSAQVGYEFNKNWSVSLAAENLTNQSYKMTDVIPGGPVLPLNEYTMGREYMATLHFKMSPAPAAPPEQAAPPPPPPPAPAAPPPPPPQKVVINLRGVNFKFDRPKPGEHNIGPTLMPPASSSLAILSQAVDTLNRYPQVQVEIDGYTDSVGNPAYNQKLSERRAQIVDDYLTSHGIDASRITAVQGFGEADPIDTNKTAAGRQRNRRVEFKVNGQGIEQGQQ
ncbi:MAG TPA: TonB-dependent receptor [Rhodanobacteraceae bacterium]